MPHTSPEFCIINEALFVIKIFSSNFCVRFLLSSDEAPIPRNILITNEYNYLCKRENKGKRYHSLIHMN